MFAAQSGFHSSPGQAYRNTPYTHTRKHGRFDQNGCYSFINNIWLIIAGRGEADCRWHGEDREGKGGEKMIHINPQHPSAPPTNQCLHIVKNVARFVTMLYGYMQDAENFNRFFFYCEKQTEMIIITPIRNWH